MIRQLQKKPITFLVGERNIVKSFFLENKTKTTMEIIVMSEPYLEGCTATFDGAEYDVTLVRHIVMVGIGAQQQYLYRLTKRPTPKKEVE